MAFNYFLIAICGLYLLYYLVMVGMDLLRIKKNNNDEEHGKDIDISDAVASYKPQVAAEVMKKESEEILREMNAGESSENNTPKVPYQEEESITDYPNPYDMPGVYFSAAKPTSSTSNDDNKADNKEDDATGSGALNIQYDPAEEMKDKYPEVNINGGYSVFHIKDMMDDMMSKNLFSHVNLV